MFDQIRILSSKPRRQFMCDVVKHELRVTSYELKA